MSPIIEKTKMMGFVIMDITLFIKLITFFTVLIILICLSFYAEDPNESLIFA
jgi:hypothetical protein